MQMPYTRPLPAKRGLHFVKAFLESVRLKARCIRGNPIWLEQLSEP